MVASLLRTYVSRFSALLGGTRPEEESDMSSDSDTSTWTLIPLATYSIVMNL
jgi:hypothetical protein